MHLYLSSTSPWNTTYRTTEGQALFKTDSLSKVFGRIITIQRVLSSSELGATSEHQSDSQAPHPVDFRDVFTPIARLQFHPFKSDVIILGETKCSSTNFFKKEGWSFYGRNRVFTGPDGREYSWHLGAGTCELFLNDGSKTKIARFQAKRRGLLNSNNRHPGFIEIFSDSLGSRVVELILITFVYVETLRAKRREEMRTAAA